MGCHSNSCTVSWAASCREISPSPFSPLQRFPCSSKMAEGFVVPRTLHPAGHACPQPALWKCQGRKERLCILGLGGLWRIRALHPFHSMENSKRLPVRHPVYLQVFLMRSGQCFLSAQDRHMEMLEWFPAKPTLQ